MQGVQSHPPQQDLYDPFTEFQSLARKNVSAADSIAFGFLGTRLVVSFLNRAISSINHLFAIKNPLANQIIMTTLDMMGRRSTYNLPSRCLNLCSVRLLYPLLLHLRALD